MRDKHSEVLHNERIFPRAEVFWGWATKAGQQRVRRRVRLMSRLAAFRTGIKVLELGCGTGIFSEYFAASDADFFAIDLSPQFISRARFRTKGNNSKFCACDAERLCFGNCYFEAVVGISILHHLDVPAVLSEIARVLRDGGTIVFTEPNMLNPQILIQKNVPIIKRLAGDSPDERAFTKWQIKALLREHGFHDIRVEPFDFMHPFLPSLAIRPMVKIGQLLESTPLIREIAGSLLISAKIRK